MFVFALSVDESIVSPTKRLMALTFILLDLGCTVSFVMLQRKITHAAAVILTSAKTYHLVVK